MPEYIKTSRVGFTLETAIEKTTSENAQIIKYRGGLRKEYIEWNPLTEQMYSPRIDPRYFKQKKIVMRAGEQVVGKEIPADMLTAGMNPFIQIIHKIVKRGGITSREDIVRALLNEERVFSATDKSSIKIIEGILEYMNEQDYYLLLHDNNLKIGFELPKSYHLVKYKKGYDPFEYHIMSLAEGQGLIKRDEIYQHIVEYLAWMKTLTKVDMYINRLLDKGNLSQAQRNYFHFVRPLKSNK